MALALLVHDVDTSGKLYCSGGAGWAAERGNAVADTRGFGTAIMYANQAFAGNFTCGRGAIGFDTAGIVATSARLVLSCDVISNDDAAAYCDLYVVAGVQSDPLTWADYGPYLPPGAVLFHLQNGVDFGTTIQWVVRSINPALLNPAGKSLFGVFIGADYNDWAPTGFPNYNQARASHGSDSTYAAKAMAASAVTSTSARLNGNYYGYPKRKAVLEVVYVGAQPTYPRYRFEWGKGWLFNHQTAWVTGSPVGAVFEDIAGLDPATDYRYRIEVEWQALSFYTSASVGFATTGSPPAVTTLLPEQAGLFKANLRGLLTEDGHPVPFGCDMRFEYGPTTAYGYTTAWVGSNNEGDIHAAEVGPLPPDVTFHFRAQARNDAFTTSGVDVTFRFDGAGRMYAPWPPGGGGGGGGSGGSGGYLASMMSVLTRAATQITDRSARLNGMVADAMGQVCRVRFEYGMTASYGASTPWQSGFVSGDAFYADISELAEEAAFHFRAVMEGSFIYGADAVFSTLAPTGPVTFVTDEFILLAGGVQ